MTVLEPPAPTRPGVAAVPVPPERSLRALLVLALGLGLALRAPLYFANPSLLLDEARLALNIASRDFAGLALPLDHDQTAPLLFLWGAKALTLLFGTNEFAMRAIPFAAGIAMLPLTYLVARRVAGNRAAVLAAGIAAVSPLYLQYVRQVKPYTLDGMTALILAWLTLAWMDAPRSRQAFLRLMLAGVLAVWLSAPAALVLAGAAAVLWFAPAGERPDRHRVLLAAVAWAASFLPTYVWIYRPAAQNPYMQEFWHGSLLRLWEPGLAARSWQAVREFAWQIFGGGSTEPPLEVVDQLAIDGVVIAVLLLSAAGIRHAARHTGAARALLLVAPLGCAVAASSVGAYPIAGRIMLFAAPGVIIAVAAGAISVVDRLVPAWRMPALAVAVLSLLGLSLPLGFTLATNPLAFEHMRLAVAEYRKRAGFREPVYVFAAALPAWTFYTTDWSSPNHARLARVARLASYGGPAFENAPPRTRPVLPSDSAGLTFPLLGTREVIGTFAGAQWRSGVGNVQFHPDTNWATVEASRIAAAGSTSGAVWMVVVRTLGLERQLFAGMQMCVDHVYRKRGVLLARFVPRARADATCLSEPAAGTSR